MDDLRLSATIGNPEIKEFEDSVFTGKYCDPFVTQDYLKTIRRKPKRY
ncbi:MAG: hypothetical protein ACJZ1Y_01960 [Candidatus Neomarinimicrobiota bacterium]